MDLKRYLNVGLRWWWLILLSVILSATASYFYSQQQPKIYAAKSTLMVGTSVVESLKPNEGVLNLSQTLAEVYSELARRQLITQAVIDRLGLEMASDQLSGMINTNIIPRAQLLEIFVLDVHPQRAQVLANAIAEELIRQSPTNAQGQNERELFIQSQLTELQSKIEETNGKVKDLEDSLDKMTSAVEIAEAQSQLTELEELKSKYQANYTQFLGNLSESSPNQLTIFEPASEPTSPVSPNIRNNVMIAALAGLVLAVGVVVLLEFFDDTLIWRRDDLELIPGTRVLGAVGKVSGNNEKLVTNYGSVEADALRNLRSSIFLAAPEQSLSTALITSPSPHEGKSYVSANLAATLATSGSSAAAVVALGSTKVILIDADLRKPTLHEIFDIPNLLGLSDVLAMPENAVEQVLKKALKATNIENLFLLPAGRTPLDPGSLFSSPKFSRVLQLLGSQANFVIIDSAPILEAVETKVVVRAVDAVMVVVSNGQTRKKMLRKLLDYFQSLDNNNLLGVIFNRVKLSSSYYYYSSYANASTLNKQVSQPQPSLLGAVLPFNGSHKDEEPSSLSLSEVAAHLGVSEDTAQRWCEQGRIPALKTGRHWSVRLEDLNEFITLYQGDLTTVSPFKS